MHIFLGKAKIFHRSVLVLGGRYRHLMGPAGVGQQTTGMGLDQLQLVLSGGDTIEIENDEIILFSIGLCHIWPRDVIDDVINDVVVRDSYQQRLVAV
jgi:hypothetical protein